MLVSNSVFERFLQPSRKTKRGGRLKKFLFSKHEDPNILKFKRKGRLDILRYDDSAAVTDSLEECFLHIRMYLLIKNEGIGFKLPESFYQTPHHKQVYVVAKIRSSRGDFLIVNLIRIQFKPTRLFIIGSKKIMVRLSIYELRINKATIRLV